MIGCDGFQAQRVGGGRLIDLGKREKEICSAVREGGGGGGEGEEREDNIRLG